MNSTRMMRAVALCSALLCFSATIAWAGCDNKDRPATPKGLRAAYGRVSVILAWTDQQTRTGLTYYDIHVRDKNGNSIPGMDITGGAGQSSTVGQLGQYIWHNAPSSPEYTFSMRARTKAGTEGCVSAEESESVTISRAQPISR